MRTIHTLSDLHVSGDPERKDMSKFGATWENHRRKIADNWSRVVKPQDIVLLNGDTIWATNKDQVMEDLRWLASLPGTKYLCEGNHCSNWWRPKPIRKSLKEEGIDNLFLTTPNDLYVLSDKYVLTGTMGWYGPKDKELFLTRNPADINRWTNEIYETTMITFYREVVLMRQALKRAKLEHPDKEIIVQTHFPPRNEMFELMKEFKVKWCVYGHLHGDTQIFATEKVEKNLGGVGFLLAACDYVNYTPVPIARIFEGGEGTLEYYEDNLK